MTDRFRHGRLRAWILALLLCLGALPPAVAVEPFTIRDIRVEGLQRTDPGTVFASLPFRIGDVYNDDKGSAALRALFATGLFKDVRLQVEGDVAVVIVEERSVIAAVSFVGAAEFDKDTLGRALKDVGIAEGMPFDRAVIDRAEQEIKRQYLSRSFYGAEVVTTVTPVERNRVNVTFTMNEGEVARIKEIRITGASAFPEAGLLELMDLGTTGWMSWYTKADRYSRSRLNGDLEKLRAHYLNRGYLEFAIESTQVTISADKQDISVVIGVREGQRYVVTGVRLDGEFLGKDDEFRALVAVRPGQPYRVEDVTATTRAFADLFGRFGYAFARVDARPEIDRARGQVSIVVSAAPERRVYVRRIEIAGNSSTRDEVIRRELRQFESSWYDSERIRLSRDRVDRLGFFKQVAVETREVPGSPDLVDLVVNVEERPTGNLMFGLGYSTAEKLTISASIRQENAFGTGQSLGVELNTGKFNRTLQFSTTDPYFTVDGISRSYELYYRTSRPLNSLSSEYQLASQGGAVRFGVPFSETDTVFFGIGLERTTIDATTALPNAYFVYRDQYGRASNALPLTLGWQRDGRDSVINPTLGRYQRANLEWSFAGDVRYLRTNLQFQQYWPVANRVTFGLNAELGLGQGLGDRPYPVFKNFYGGGLGSVRGFDQGSMGAVDPTGAFIGGNRRLNLNGELYLPFPGLGNDRTVRFFAFGDVGNVWAEGQAIDAQSLRASVGLGLSWLSPVGPLKLSWGKAVRSQATDRIQPFQFQIGTAF
jgi:outer membrane protein insertion porin family